MLRSVLPIAMVESQGPGHRGACVYRCARSEYKPEGTGNGYVTITQPATAPVACISPTRPFFRPSDVEAAYQHQFRRPWILRVSDDPDGASGTLPVESY